MTLTLTMVRCPDDVVPERREVAGGEFSIGRGPDNHWILPDPDRHLSKRHCAVTCHAGQWHVADLSANGTFLNFAATPLGAGALHPLRTGDRIGLGAYEIEVAIKEAPAWDAPMTTAPGAAGTRAALPADDLDPFGPSPRSAFDAEPLPGRAGGNAGGGWSELGEEGAYPGTAPDPFAEDDFPLREPVHSDHAPALADAFRPPPPPAAALPDDWDLDLSETTPVRPSGPTEPPPTMPSATKPPAPAPLPPAGGATLLAAFLRGAGLEDVTSPDPEAMLERVGAALRATVAGIRETMIARAEIKGEFRIEQTMIQASGNNPLKFSAGNDDALSALLGVGRRNAMPAAEAIAEALRDIRLHELATITAMQRAVQALLATLAPATIEQEADRGGRTLLPGQKKARAWEAFEAAHGRIARALSDDFDSVFGKSFARAYEQSMREMQAQDHSPQDGDRHR